MLSSKKRMNVKELPCHICTISTPVYQLKAYTQGNWICSTCADRIYNKKARPSVQPKEQKIEFKKINFDPFEENVQETNFIKESPKPQVNKPIKTLASPVKDNKPFKKTIISKSLYRCNYCSFKFRYSRQDETCTNCGRNNFLIRIPPIAEVLDDVKRNPIFD